MSRRGLRAAGLFALLLAAPPGAGPPLLHAQSARLARVLDRRLDTPPFDRQLWGVAVVDERGRLLYGRNPERLFMPASTAKLVVAAVAAALLPPGWTVRTGAYAAGPMVNGVLQGDLVLYGRGDPTWSRRCFGADTTRPGACEPDPAAPLRRLVDSLRARGLRTVAGDVVGDGSWFEPLLVHPDWQSYDLNWWYASPVSGLGFNDNSVELVWSAGPAPGGPARIAATPPFAGITLENRTLTIPGDTGTTIDFFRDPGTLRVRAVGRVAQSASGNTEHLALPDPNRYAAEALRALLLEAGIAVLGDARSTTDSLRYAAARAGPPLAEIVSRPLGDWIFPILNSSQNWFAEMLLKQLGRRFGRGGSWAEGLAVERRFLIDSVKIDSLDFALTDGSGLAATNLITPRALVRLLQYMRRRPGAEAFAAALPRSGGRGSLRARFAGTAAAGRVAAKPGSFARVNGLAGYLELDGGRTVTFSVLANHHALPGRLMAAQIDSVIVDLARELSRR